jgi:APA family basic amino acid/polyamine antiporter
VTEAPTPELRRTLGLVDGVALLVGITIGSGIYSTPHLIAGYFPNFSSLITTWMIVGVFVMIGGLIYAELGTRLPTTGGEYVYLSRCFGPFAGFMFGWAQLFIVRTSPTAGLAMIAADYIRLLAHLDARSHTAVALGIIAAIGVFNYVGVQWASLFQKVTTVIKVAGLILFAAGGVILLRGMPNLLATEAPPTQLLGTAGNTVAALMLIVFTHTGWDRVGYVAGEMKNPREVIPRSMVLGITLILAIYWATNTIYHYALGMEGVRATTTPAATVATLMIGPVGAAAVAVLAIVSAVSSINGTTMSASRVYYAMARDGLFFRWLDHVHPVFRTPSRAVLAHCAWAAVILLVRGSFEAIVAGMVFVILIFYGMTTLALFKLRRQRVGEDRAFRMPLFPWLPALYFLGIVGLLVARATLSWRASVMDLAFVAIGLPFSFFWLSRRSPSRPIPQP